MLVVTSGVTHGAMGCISQASSVIPYATQCATTRSITRGVRSDVTRECITRRHMSPLVVTSGVTRGVTRRSTRRGTHRGTRRLKWGRCKNAASCAASHKHAASCAASHGGVTRREHITSSGSIARLLRHAMRHAFTRSHHVRSCAASRERATRHHTRRRMWRHSQGHTSSRVAALQENCVMPCATQTRGVMCGHARRHVRGQHGITRGIIRGITCRRTRRLT